MNRPCPICQNELNHFTQFDSDFYTCFSPDLHTGQVADEVLKCDVIPLVVKAQVAGDVIRVTAGGILGIYLLCAVPILQQSQG